ncbi:MAG: hypothetical protein ACE5HK_07245 [Candidatus Methylomirabilales bacterium]
MESKELLYTSYRILELKSLLPEDAGTETREVAEALAEKGDDEGLIALLEKQPLSETSGRRLEIIKASRPVAHKIVQLWREMPLRHEAIEQEYKKLRRYKLEYDEVAPRRGHFTDLY